MTDPRPAPLVAEDVDLRDFGFMPLDVLRLRDSDLAALANGEEFKAAVLLWCVAWHQVPAASLPSDDRLLARYSGAGPAWKRVREEALRGFVECSDGRLYHTTIAEKANESWRAKQAQRDRTRAATEAREAKRRAAQVQRDGDGDEHRNVTRDDQRDVERNVVQGTVKGQGQGIEEKERAQSVSQGLPASAPADPPPEANGHTPTPAGLVCRAMRRAGLLSVNPGDPRLLALLAQGATEVEFVAIATEAVEKRKGWPWVLAVLQSRRAEAAEIALAPPPAVDPMAWAETQSGVNDRAARLGLEAWDGIRPWASYRRHVIAAHTAAQGATA